MILINLEQAIKKAKQLYKKPNRVNEEREVIERFGNMFHPDNLDELTKDNFRSFHIFLRKDKDINTLYKTSHILDFDLISIQYVLSKF